MVLLRSSRALLPILRQVRCSFHSQKKSSVTFSSLRTLSQPFQDGSTVFRTLSTKVPGEGHDEGHHGHLLLPDTAMVQVIDLKSEITKMTFGELRVMALEAKESKGRDLIHVHAGGRKEGLPTFRLLKPTELEAMVRKSRQYNKHLHFSKVPLDGQKVGSSRIKEKQITIRVGVLDHDLEVATNKITKWLQKDAFVRVTIEASGERKKEAQDLQNLIKEKCLVGGNESKAAKLTIK